MFRLFGSKKRESENVVTESPAVENTVLSSGGEVLSDKMSDKKLVAVVTAAIACYMGKSDCSFNVLSIEKIS